MPTPIGKFVSERVYDSKLYSKHSITSRDCVTFVNAGDGEEVAELGGEADDRGGDREDGEAPVARIDAAPRAGDGSGEEECGGERHAPGATDEQEEDGPGRADPC